MKDVYMLKEVEAVTKIAKNIFGDIVHKVYYAESHYSTVEEAETIARIDREIASSFHTENSIDQDGRTIVIEFVNGRSVVFSNSEWGAMEKFEFDENVVCI
jgi:hypothetical protein